MEPTLTLTVATFVVACAIAYRAFRPPAGVTASVTPVEGPEFAQVVARVHEIEAAVRELQTLPATWEKIAAEIEDLAAITERKRRRVAARESREAPAEAQQRPMSRDEILAAARARMRGSFGFGFNTGRGPGFGISSIGASPTPWVLGSPSPAPSGGGGILGSILQAGTQLGVAFLNQKAAKDAAKAAGRARQAMAPAPTQLAAPSFSGVAPVNTIGPAAGAILGGVRAAARSPAVRAGVGAAIGAALGGLGGEEEAAGALPGGGQPVGGGAVAPAGGMSMEVGMPNALTFPFAPTMSGSRAQTFIALNPSTGAPTWFRPAGRPILWSSDLTACRRVNKIARRARGRR